MAHADQLDEAGHRLVVRNGYHGERQVMTAAGTVPVQAPRVNDKRIDGAMGGRIRFASAILPAWVRKSPKIAEVLPLLYLHGLSSGDFGPTIESTFATVRLRTRVTKGPGSRAAGIAMAFKLIESSQARWCAVNAPHLVALVRAGATFVNSKLLERPDENGGDAQVA